MMFSIFRIHSYCVPAFSACISIAPGGFLDCFGMLLGCLTFWGAFWLLLGWTVCMHFYCIPALFACISFLHAIRLITSFLYSSTACVHTYSVLALFCVHSPYDSAMSLCAFLLHSSTDCVHSHSSPTLLHAYTFICLTFSPCAFLQCSSTVGVKFYCIAALFAYISIVS